MMEFLKDMWLVFGIACTIFWTCYLVGWGLGSGLVRALGKLGIIVNHFDGKKKQA